MANCCLAHTPSTIQERGMVVTDLVHAGEPKCRLKASINASGNPSEESEIRSDQSGQNRNKEELHKTERCSRNGDSSRCRAHRRRRPASTLSGGLDAHTVSYIRYALLHHKVIFFRGQQHRPCRQDQPLRSCRECWWRIRRWHRAKGTSYVLELYAAHGGRANQWHTDVTFVDRHPSASILRAIVVPSYGGDTVWANTATAYNDLTPELRDAADRLAGAASKRVRLRSGSA